MPEALIATRASRLARIQAEAVRQALAAVHPDLVVFRRVLVEGGQANRIAATGDPTEPKALGEGAARRLASRV